MRKGLTLMELLVVISILTTLAALLYPIYLKVRSRMYAISCANQLRQIGLAIKMYVNDQGQENPYFMPPNLGRLYPQYIHDRDFLICPRVQALVPQEILKEIRQVKVGGSPWSSYWQVFPKAIDSIAKQYPGEHVSFSEVFAKRGDMTPVALCEFHRYCSFLTFSFKDDTRASAWAEANCYHPNRDIFLTLGGPLIVLRWGGSVHFVYKGHYWISSSSSFLLDY